MKRSFTAYLLLLASVLPAGGDAFAAGIRAWLAPVNPIAGEPFQLILETTDTAHGEPDFSALTRDFEILHRARSQRTRSLNGRISQQTSWRLTLLNRTVGTNRIPAIPFGNDASNPVLFDSRQASEGPETSSLANPLTTPLPARTPPPVERSQALTLPLADSPPAEAGTTLPVTEAPARSLWSLLLASIPGGILMLVWWQQRRQLRASPDKPVTNTIEERFSPESEELQQACRSNDAEAAARALLQWATLRWPGSPPAGVGPLARRFAGTDVELEMRKLEQVLYSPHEKQWQGASLWQVMKDLVLRPGGQR